MRRTTRHTNRPRGQVNICCSCSRRTLLTYGCPPGPGRRRGTRSPQSRGPARSRCSTPRRLWSYGWHPPVWSRCQAFAGWSPACGYGTGAAQSDALAPLCGLVSTQERSGGKRGEQKRERERVTIYWRQKRGETEEMRGDNKQRVNRREEKRKMEVMFSVKLYWKFLLSLMRLDRETNLFVSLLFPCLDREGLHFTLKLVHLHV